MYVKTKDTGRSTLAPPEASTGTALGAWQRALVAGILVLGLAACDQGVDSNPGSAAEPNPSTCSIPTSLLVSGGVPRDGIPALTDPPLVGPDEVDYLSENSRVIGLVVGGQAIAVPHNILWWHEIVNFNFAEVKLAVTYCPLTGSSMAFDRAVVGGAEFGVSGLLFQNNLTMYDRTSEESLWPQMNRQAGCGPRDGTALAMYPVLEMTWAGWRTLYPETRVISGNTGFDRLYNPLGYPYGDYERPDNDRLLFSMPIDRRRPPKERLLGIPSGEGGIAFPFGALETDETVRVVNETVDEEPVVVFWDDARGGAAAYHALHQGAALTFEVRGGEIVDAATGSTWRIDGRAVAGPLSGAQLEPVAEAYVAFWFAWAAFQPEARLWSAP